MVQYNQAAAAHEQKAELRKATQKASVDKENTGAEGDDLVASVDKKQVVPSLDIR